MNRDALLDRIRVPGTVLLDGWSDAGRWTIALPDPVDEFRVEWGEENRLDEFLRTRHFESGPNSAGGEIPFTRGWVGFISYEVGSSWEGAQRREPNAPEPAALFYRHESGLAVAPDGEVYRFAAGKIDRIEGELARSDSRLGPSAGSAKSPRPSAAVRFPSGSRSSACAGASAPAAHGPSLEVPPAVQDSLPEPEYERAHEEIRRGIARGDYYQVNLTRRFAMSVESRPDPRDLYRLLAGPHPPPYSAIVRAGGTDVISASPELFLRADWTTRRVEMRPIKGTAARGTDPEEDRRLAEELSRSAKDRAENVMIVDLCRHDLGRVCEPGSVSAPELCRLRSHRLHHLESTVEGSLHAEITAADLLHSTFPPGSVTGAPKRAAVGAISRLEPVARGVYTGAVGYLDDRGRVAFNVAIRTAISTSAEVRYHAGGGITWDSSAEAESRESRWKANEFFALLASLRRE